MKTLTIIGLALLCFASCKKDPIKPVEPDPACSVNHTGTIKFINTSSGRTFKISLNDTMSFELAPEQILDTSLCSGDYKVFREGKFDPKDTATDNFKVIDCVHQDWYFGG